MNKLSSKHFMFFILGCSIIALRSYSSIFIKLGGRDTWILAFFASLIFIIFTIYLLKICVKTDTFDIKVIFAKAFPTWLTTIFTFLFAFGLMLCSIEAASVEASSIHTNLFLSTPTWYCLLFLIIPASYVLLRKFNSILILVIITVSLTLLGDIALLALISRYLDFRYLLPIMDSGMTTNKWFCLLLILGSLSSVVIALPYLKFLSVKKGILTNSTLALIICTILIVSSFISVITFFGPERGGNIFYPEYVQSQRVQIAHFLEFGELFYIFRSICIWFVKYILSSYGILLLYKDKIKNKKVFVTVYSLLIFIVSWFLTKNQYFLFFSLEILQLILLAIFILIPLTVFTSYYIRFRKLVKTN